MNRANDQPESGLRFHRPHHPALELVTTIREWLGEMVDSEADGSWHFPAPAARDFRGQLVDLLEHLYAVPGDDERPALLHVFDHESDTAIPALEADRCRLRHVLDELIELAGCHERPATTWAEVERTFCRFASSLDVYMAKGSAAAGQAVLQDGEPARIRMAK